MGNKADNRTISEFWDWFSKNRERFGVEFNNTELLGQLDDWIARLGNFSWEIGPGKLKENALVISPGGDLHLLKGSKRIVEEAKEFNTWEFYYAKQPKQWALAFNFEGSTNAIIKVDGSKWQYVLLRYDDGMFEIIVKAPELYQLDEWDRKAAVEILLDGMLGEELRMQHICAIDVVKEFEKLYQSSAGKINNLAAHLKNIIKG